MKKITLTFDNGPDPDVTPRVLDTLAQHGIKTTFFVVGDKMRDSARRALSERAKAEGHWIGNHTYNHLVPLGLSRHEAASPFEIGATQELIGDLAHEMKFFRPFGGGGHIDSNLLDSRAYDYLQAGGFTCVLWNVVPRDWETPDHWVGEALRQCGDTDRPLVVLHDITTGAMEHLPRFIDAARQAGMDFVQEHPCDCVPMLRGDAVRDMSAYIAKAA